jgi:hypothetical protein
MKNKIVFITIISFAIIFGFSIISCNEEEGGTVKLKNETNENVYFIAFSGVSSLNEINKKIKELDKPENEQKKKDSIVTIESVSTKEIPFYENTIISYKWWTDSELFDFGSTFMEKGRVETITVTPAPTE